MSCTNFKAVYSRFKLAKRIATIDIRGEIVDKRRILGRLDMEGTGNQGGFWDWLRELL